MEVFPRRPLLAALICCSVIALAACGGGGGGGGGNNPTTATDSGTDTNWQPGNFLPASTFANRCVSPRSGTDANGDPYGDVKGTRLDENNWLRSMSHELYLWYDEIEDIDPADFDDSLDYFAQLKTFALTPSGNQKDRFHYTVPTEQWNAQTQSGVFVGYGLQWALVSLEPPRRAVVAYTDSGAPLEVVDSNGQPVNITRGAEVLTVDGVDLAYSNDVDTLNAGMWPAQADEQHSFEIRPLGATDSVTVTLTAAANASKPVQHVEYFDNATTGKRIGYLLFNDHIATAEPALIDAVNQLGDWGVDELVLDLRYNSGGYLYIASQLAYMIAGDMPTAGQPFEQVVWNDQHPTTDPVTDQPLQPMPFYTVTSGNVGTQADLPLPSLNLPRVYVLSGSSTCSASESIINSLRGVGVDVVLIGATTCGKPYGFYGLDNCGTMYFTIQFKGVNASGFGDYTDGFVPAGTTGTDADVHGCKVGDDFDHLLGDESEGRLATAIYHIETGSCGTLSASAYSSGAVGSSLSAGGARVSKPLWRSNRIMVR
ncbi:S41 family peptidase [Microbulbifer sp. SAOS-129_SWC]|uniref:S41 family peptidase n=1 Tax=Microbulbifer sp. SAOS-129_SWC TaxID=3145235 RepID=UPI00321684F1